MTVLVLDSPELIARAAALEAAQASEVQVEQEQEQAKVDVASAAVAAPSRPYQPQSARESVLRRAESLALVS